MSDIESWLAQHGLSRYAEIFAENGIEFDVFPEITEKDLKDFGISFGDRKRLLRAIQQTLEAPDESLLQAEGTRAAASEAERRQLSVMFCDLVGSVELGERMDIEDYRDVLARFRNAIVESVERYGGFVARHQGDGVLTYFGYPHARENDAERAVLAGLSAITQVEQLEHPYPTELQVRAGVATGIVVVGDTLSTGSVAELAAFGPTPNLAARLQGLAKPNSLLISETTYQLTRERLDVEAIPNVQVKGHEKKITAYRVLGLERPATGKRRATRARSSPLLGRKTEQDLLTQRWRQARTGEGQVVMLCGDPGVGKTCLLQELDSRILGDSANRVFLSCSMLQQNTALFPVRKQLEDVLDLHAPKTAPERRSLVESWLGQLEMDVARHEPILSRLLDLTDESDHRTSALSNEQLRARTLKALTDTIVSASRQRPTLLVVEDLHWADPTTLAFIGQLLSQLATLRLLVLLTFRPEFDAPWVNHPQGTLLTLRYLGAKDCGALVHQLMGTSSLPEDIIKEIVAKSDGVPLFVEELTKTVVELGSVSHTDVTTIPATLQDSLMARLDRLGVAKRVAQMAAVIGRDFEHAILRVISDDPEGLNNALAALESSEVVERQGVPPKATYHFRHALLQEAAYQSLLSPTRRDFHMRVARTLDSCGELASMGSPELLATHYERAGSLEKSVDFRWAAGSRAVRAHALHEAEFHFKTGLENAGKLEHSSRSGLSSADAILALGAVQMTLYGFGSEVVRDTYRQARLLTAHLGDQSRKFDATWGLWLNRNVTGDLDAAQTLIEEIEDLAKNSDDSGHTLQAHHAGWTTLYILGDLENTSRHTNAGIDLYTLNKHKEHAFRYGGHDPGVCGYSHAALTNFILGFPERAIKSWSDGMQLAEKLEHPSTLGVARNFGSVLFQLLRDPEQVRAVSTPNPASPAHFQFMTLAAHGWALAHQGLLEEGLNECRRGVEGYRKTGARARLSYIEYVFADVLHLAGQEVEALSAVESAIENAVDQATVADLYRLKGDVLRASRIESLDEAEQALLKSLSIARGQRARTWELRTAMSLARLYVSDGDVERARELVAPIYDTFTEGFGTPDLRDGKALLDTLSE